MGLKTFTIDFSAFSQETLVRSNYKTAILGIEIKKHIQKSENKFIRLKEYFDIVSGFAFKSADYEQEGLPLIRIGDVGNDFDENNMVFLPEDYRKDYERFLLKKNDIVVSLTGDGKLKNDLILEDNKYLLNQRVGSLRAKKNTNVLFFYYLINYYSLTKKQFYWLSNGKTQLNISPFDFLKIKIPLIPKPKQDQIVTQIEPIEQKIKELKVKIKEPQEVINKVFAREFKIDLEKVEQEAQKKHCIVSSTLSFRNPNLRSSARWHKFVPIQKVMYENTTCITKLGDYIISTKNGWSPSCQESDSLNLVFGVNCISKHGVIRFDDMKISDQNRENIETYFAQENDLFVSRGNTTDLVALASVVENLPDDNNIIFSDLFIRVDVDEEKISKKYLAYLFNSIIGRYYFKYSAKGKNQTMVKISSNEINSFFLPLPSLDIQQKIIDEIKTELDAQEKIKTEIEIEQNKIDEVIENAIKSSAQKHSA